MRVLTRNNSWVNGEKRDSSPRTSKRPTTVLGRPPSMLVKTESFEERIRPRKESSVGGSSGWIKAYIFYLCFHTIRLIRFSFLELFEFCLYTIGIRALFAQTFSSTLTYRTILPWHDALRNFFRPIYAFFNSLCSNCIKRAQ